MSYNSQSGIITKHSAESGFRFIGSVGNYNHTGMYAVTHAHTASMVQANPACAACCIYQRI